MKAKEKAGGAVAGADADSFEQFGLSAPLMKAIGDVGYETPSPIQLKTIPLLLAGRDVVGQAQTGTGKTAAFALPILERIDAASNDVQALVLTPTRELAIQVAEAFHTYARHMGRVRVLPVYGGQPIQQQLRRLHGGAQVVVGTPGRVMDHLRRETLDIAGLKFVVLDEADEMLRMGFVEDVEWILGHTPAARQTALFSATMPREVRRIAERHLRDAAGVQIEHKTLTVPTVRQFYVNVSEGQKLDALTRILEAEASAGEAVLIFDRTKIGAAELTEKLQARGYAAEAMHGDMSQSQRETVIRRLRGGQVEIVVATDVAARGLDVERIAWVVNYDMPNDEESYVHRIGRTGRAGREGRAVLFVTPRQQRMMREIERFTGQRIEPMRVPTGADVAARRVALFKERIMKTLKGERLELYLSLVEELAEESGRDVAEIAAAAAYLAGGDKPLEVELEPAPDQLGQPADGLVRLFIDVGRLSRVGPSDIVGAIANEAGVPGKAIGAIDVHDRFTLVELPAEFVAQVLERMRGKRIRNHNANVRVAEEGGAGRGDARRGGAGPRDAGGRGRGGARKGGKKPYKR
ncbi:MAG TPA: DEAD/DEAH box helicase [Pyrinomonadaceae bacterium]|jgi:ATP-dependent RNA helicase DeaD